MTTRKAVQMCCINIGYYRLLIPMEKGMKVITLLSEAVECTLDLDGKGVRYQINEQPSIDFTMVRPDQIIFRDGSYVGQHGKEPFIPLPPSTKRLK